MINVAKRTEKLEGDYWLNHPSYLPHLMRSAIKNNKMSVLVHNSKSPNLWVSGEHVYVDSEESIERILDEIEAYAISMYKQGEQLGLVELESMIEKMNATQFSHKALLFFESSQADQYFDGRDWSGWQPFILGEGRNFFFTEEPLSVYQLEGIVIFVISIMTGVSPIVIDWWVKSKNDSFFDLTHQGQDAMISKLIDDVKSWVGFEDFRNSYFEKTYCSMKDLKTTEIILLIVWAEQTITLETLMKMCGNQHLLNEGDIHGRKREMRWGVANTGFDNIIVEKQWAAKTV